MSRETLAHLNTQTLKGFTDSTGYAWHYDAASQGDESNHYPGAIPVGDVERRLFSWTAVPRRVAVELPADVETMTHLNEAGEPARWVVQLDRQAMARDDNDSIMGMFKDGYQAHQYKEWLLGAVSNILGNGLAVGSAGLLKGGAVAWVQVELPASVHTPQGVEFRPRLLGGTSFDGSIATFWKRVMGIVVCDNTMEIARREAGQQYKIKHTRNSGFKLNEARQALDIIVDSSDEFAAEIADLCATEVTAKQWDAFLNELAPLSEDGEAKTGRALTLASNKQDSLRRLWNNDTRVSPWKGTAFGVVQALNTWAHHEQTVRGTSRDERNMLNAITGATAKEDAATMSILTKVLATV